MNKKILSVFAHPDDEAFGPGGTLAKYGHSKDVEIHLLCATRGESGEWSDESRINLIGQAGNQESGKKNIKLHNIRESELLESAKILGVKRVEFLNFVDGELRNNIYHELAEKIMSKIEEFRPDVVLTNERLGVSGHLDHIAVSLTTTYAYLKTKTAKKLYYYCITKENRDRDLDKYFIYFPEGYDAEEITTVVDYKEYYPFKVEAMQKHVSQMKDVKRILARLETQEKKDNFILQHTAVETVYPESDLFSGLD